MNKLEELEEIQLQEAFTLAKIKNIQSEYKDDNHQVLLKDIEDLRRYSEILLNLTKAYNNLKERM